VAAPRGHEQKGLGRQHALAVHEVPQRRRINAAQERVLTRAIAKRRHPRVRARFMSIAVTRAYGGLKIGSPSFQEAEGDAGGSRTHRGGG